MTHQVGLTFSAAVAPEREDSLRELLRRVDADPAHNDVLPFASLPEVHFARFVVLDADAAGGAHATLLLTVDADAPEARRLDDLTELVGSGIDAVCGHCIDYPDEPTPESRRAWLEGHLDSSDVFYVHAVGRTLAQVLDEARLRRAVSDFLDADPQRFAGLGDREAHLLIRSFVADDPALAWALRPAERPELAFRVGETVHKYAVIAALVVLLPVLIPATVVWALALRYHEIRDPFTDREPDADRLRVLGDREDFGAQNQFTSIASIRPGGIWRLTSRLTLWIGSFTARHVFTTGSLSGLTTVHFARFLRFGPEKRLLFTSYYDGSLESYNNDFVDQVAWVLNTVFGQQDGYPRTRWMVLQGAHDERWFKDFIRGHQVETQVWYSAYPTLAAVTIDQNARLRAGLGANLERKELRSWLELL